MQKAKDNLNNLLEVKNITDTSADLYFYGDIVSNWWGAFDDTDQYPEKIKNFLSDVNGRNLNIYVNSGGGSVFAGFAIYHMLKRYEGFKTVYIDGLAGSIMSIIVLAGDRIIMPKNAYYMAHKPLGRCCGNAIELREYAALLDKLQIGLMEVYKEHLKPGADFSEFVKLIDTRKGYWFSANEILNYFSFELCDSNKAVAYCGDSDFLNSISAEIPNDYNNKTNIDIVQAKLNLLNLKGDLLHG